MPKRAFAVADSDEDELNDELPLRNAKGSFEAKPHDDPEKVQELGRYLETIGGSAALVQSWTCMVRTKTTSGEQWTIYADENNRRFRSRNEVAAHFGLHVQKAKKAAARSASTSTALTPSVSALTEADAEKMTVVWATLKGYPPWPAEVVGASGRHYTVRFFATDNEATLPESALTRYNKKQRTLRAGQGRSVGSATLRAQFFEAVSLADEALGEDSGDLNWRTDGCPWIGQRVRRFFSGGVPSDATVERWLPAGDTADDFALWHVVHDDGDEEDLEEHELLQAAAAAATDEPAEAAAHGAHSPATLARALREPSRQPQQHAAASPASHGVLVSTALAARGAQLEGMDAVRAALVEMKLESYAPALEAEGWDDLAFLVATSETRRREIGNSVGMKPGHAMKFAAWLVPVAERIHATD